MSSSIVVHQHDGTLKSKEQWQHYFDEFAPLKDKPVKMLELGVFHGRSLHMWNDYFTDGSICGIDAQVPLALGDQPQFRFFRGDQQDTEFLDHVAGKVAPDGFDIIIDDCSHIGSVTKVSFWHLFERHLKPGGLYIIEDWQTGYLPQWEDGEALTYDPRETPPEGNCFHGHQVGMVGFVKELVDELASRAFCIPAPDDARRSRISQLKFLENQVFVYKPKGAGEQLDRVTDAA